MNKNAEFSIESLTGSIYGTSASKKKSTESATVLVKNGLLPTLFESCESVEYYLDVARESYCQGRELCDIAHVSIESLAMNTKLVAKAKIAAKAQGCESFSFSVEAAGIDAKAVVKKVIFTVKAAIQKFITAIGNFIKSVSNWVGSKLAAGQDRTLNDAKAKGLAKVLKAAGAAGKLKGIPVENPLQKFSGAAFAGLKELTVIAALDFTSGEGATKLEDQMKKQTEDLKNSFINKIAGNNAALKSYISGGASSDGFKVPNGSVAAKVAVYGSENPEATEINPASLKPADFEILSKKSLSDFSAVVKVAKDSAAAMGRTAKQCDTIMADVGKSETTKDQTKQLMWVKNIHGFVVGYILSYYSLFLKTRSVYERVLKTGMGSAGKADAKAGAAPAKK